MPFLVAILAIALGAAFCFVGYRFFKILLPIWGFFAGLWLGAYLMSSLFGQGGFLVTTTGIVVGVILGLVLAVLSYFLWYIGVAIWGGTIGYALVASIWQGIGLNPGFIMTILGILVGIVFFLLFFFLNLQKYLVIVVTALGGSAAVISGVLLLFGQVSLDAMQFSLLVPIIRQSFFWTLLWLVLFVIGVIAQIQTTRTYVLTVDEMEGTAW